MCLHTYNNNAHSFYLLTYSLVKGQDGKMYYTDAAEDAASTSTAYVPTAKKLVPSARSNTGGRNQ
jgi:hypothetical protein